MTSVSSDRAGVLAAIETSLMSADKATQLSLSSGFTVPVQAERVLKQAALTCATKYFEENSKEELALLTAVLQKFIINTKTKKPNTMLTEMLRAWVTRGIIISSEELGIWHANNARQRLGPSLWVCICPPINSISIHPELNVF